MLPASSGRRWKSEWLAAVGTAEWKMMVGLDDGMGYDAQVELGTWTSSTMQSWIGWMDGNCHGVRVEWVAVAVAANRKITMGRKF